MGKPKKGSLGERMKEYENVSRIYLTRRMPLIIRIDGRCFHTFCKGLKRPFDDILINTMQDTMKYLCENIQNCVFGYTQSDEISLVLVDYQKINTAAWFDNNLQKIVSISASMATLKFNEMFSKNAFAARFSKEFDYTIYFDKMHSAIFDSRAFLLPMEEVSNYLIWRQQDTIRNSHEMLGRYYFSHKALYKKNAKMIEEMLLNEHNVDWNDLPTKCKIGSCCIRDWIDEFEGIKEWQTDNEIPLFTEHREYINRFIFV